MPVEDIGERCNTIAYTLVWCGRRVDRVYTGQPRNEEAKDRLCVWRLRRGPCQVAGSVSVWVNGIPK